MLAALRWTTGITWDTPLRDIGWAWLILGGIVAGFLLLLRHLVRTW